MPKPRSKRYQYPIVRVLFAECDPGRLGRCAGHCGRTADAPSAFGVFAAHKMASAGAFSLDLARSGNLDSFAQTLVGLLFRHLITFLKRICKPGTLRDLPAQVNIITGTFSKKSAIGFVFSTSVGHRDHREHREERIYLGFRA